MHLPRDEPPQLSATVRLQRIGVEPHLGCACCEEAQLSLTTFGKGASSAEESAVDSTKSTQVGDMLLAPDAIRDAKPAQEWPCAGLRKT